MINKRDLVNRIKVNFPKELLGLDQWVCWRIEVRDDKPTKVPYSVNGYRAASDKPATWASFETACKVYLNGNYNGIGFMFSEHDPYVGIDFDKCIDDGGNVDPEKWDLIFGLGSYTERSQSGTGIHIIAKGTLPPGGRKSSKQQIEIYDRLRFFVVTGDVLPDYHPSVEDRQAEIEHFHKLVFPAKEQTAQTTYTNGNGQIPTDDQALLDRMFASKNGADIQALWLGNKAPYNGDESAADLALCNHLAFWTGNDAARMDRLFRQSRLYREHKWDRNARTGEKYGEGTISRAIAATQETYSPHRQEPREIQAVESVAPTLHQNGNGSHNHAQVNDGYAQDTPTNQPTNQKPKTKNSTITSEEYVEALESLGYHFRMNELDDTIEVNGQALNEGLKAEIRSRMRDIGYAKTKVMEDAYTAHAYHKRYHPVKQYLKSLTWQGEDMIAKVAEMVTDQMTPITYPDGKQLSVFHAYFKRWIIGACARALDSAQNAMLVLVAKQGLGKSRFVNWLGSGMPDLFVEGAIKPDNKEHDRMLASKWIWEVGELGATTKRADVEALKDFLTRKTVTFRVPYAVNPITKAALTSFIGTVNPSTGFLTDITGNRRFMTVEVIEINYAYQALDVNQLWAQAMHLYLAGESFELSPEEKARQSNDNERHQIEDPYEGWLFRFCDVDPSNAEWSQTTTELTALLQEQGVRGETRTIQMRLSETLRSVGLRQHANARPRRWIGIRVKPVFDK